jgi:hypothetical protein
MYWGGTGAWAGTAGAGGAGRGVGEGWGVGGKAVASTCCVSGIFSTIFDFLISACFALILSKCSSCLALAAFFGLGAFFSGSGASPFSTTNTSDFFNSGTGSGSTGGSGNFGN